MCSISINHYFPNHSLIKATLRITSSASNNMLGFYRSLGSLVTVRPLPTVFLDNGTKKKTTFLRHFVLSLNFYLVSQTKLYRNA